MKKFIYGCAICLFATAVQAQVVQPVACQPTPKVAIENYPGAKNIPHGNNLLLPGGKAIAASGQRVMLLGRVFDSRCMPVAGAMVELWQNDPYGKWILATPEDLATPNPTFAGAGRAITDTTGQFIFITAFPAPLKGRAPHFNLRISMATMPVFTTQLFFNDDTRNATDPNLRKLSLEARQRVMLAMQPLAADSSAGLSGVIDLVLPGAASYRRY